MNETELAAAIAAGTIPSPVQCGGFWLYALRFSGTGTVWREARQEMAHRAPENYLTPAFLQRVPGVPVVANHPEGAKLDGEEFDQRTIGTCGYPYIADSNGIENPAGDEVWTVARIYSQAAVDAMAEHQLSTSPAVFWRKGEVGETVDLPDGSQILIENAPVILDHLAVCDLGVFDRGGPPTGVRCDSERGTMHMTEEEIAADRARKDAEEMKGNIDKVLQHLGRLDAICARLDALEGGGKGGPGNGLEIDHGRGTRVDPVKEREEFAQMADAQARADSVYQALGQRAPMPMSGENLANYRVRLGRGLQLHSKQFAKVDLHAVRADAEAFNAIEGVIYADALVSARNPQVAEGHIQKRERTLESGHKCVEFFGSTTIFKAFAPPAMRATKFLVPNHSSH